MIILAITITFVFISNGVGAQNDVKPAFNRDNLIRLHVLAHSDDPEDQRVKLLVRDRLIRESRELFIGARDSREAMGILLANRERVLATVRDELRRNHKNYGAHLEVGVFPFPVRDYPFGRLPAGQYHALRVVLGKGAGHNWWCVLFPPLCFMTTAEKDRNYYRRNQEKVVYRCAFLERILRRNHMVFDDFWQRWARFFEKTS